MTLAVRSAPTSPPEEDDWLAAIVQRPGMLGSLGSSESPRAVRVLCALPLGRLLAVAERVGDEEAAGLYKSWLGLNPDALEAYAVWFNLGVSLMRLGEKSQSAVAYENALVLKPDLHEAMVNLGLVREALGDPEEAMRVWRRAVPAAGHRRILHMHLGRMLEERGDLGAATDELRAALLIDPDQPDVQQHLVHLRQRMAMWPVLASDVPGLSVEELARNCGPLAALALHDDPAIQRDITAAWIARKLPPAPERLAPARGYRHDRIRIGYLSSDFCRHAMAFLIAEMLELHDRAAFEVYGYCASPEDGSGVRARMLGAFDHFVRIAEIGDEAAARRIRADEIDILVDLNGLTKGGRLGVLRWKPAPVQATYLGYVGPVPVPELDWLICDDIVVPPDLAHAYAPRPLPLAGCYQANDSKATDLPAVSRAEEGLPARAFVYCCFSHHYKITPRVFDAWLAILERSGDAVLWLVDDGPISRRNLVARWAAHGLAPERLIFAARVDPARYRARMALADLFLDTTPYNAGTVASDALRMGLPILTVRGRAFAARMATSLLTTMDLPELIAETMDDYVLRATTLADDPVAHVALRARLGGDRWARSLGDAAAFTRRLEDAYRRVRLCV